MNTIQVFKTKREALAISGGCTKTTKMPSESYSLPAKADRKSTRLNSSHIPLSRMPSSA
mgnify:CR=1 FL=1